MEKEIRKFPCPFSMGLCHCQICPEGTEDVSCISGKRKENLYEFCGRDVFECIGFEPCSVKNNNANTN